MIRWQQIRSCLLLVTLCSVFAILGKSILEPPSAAKRAVTPAPLVFPVKVPLAGWQSSGSRPLANHVVKHQKYLSGRLYQYRKKGLPITIEMLYVIENSGNVMGFISNYTSIPSSAIRVSSRTERHQAGVGYYMLFTHQQRAYLTSCINPRGDSTISLPQFQQNRYTYDIQFSSLLRWLFSQENIRDLRCLWVHMSVPLSTALPEQVYPMLEDAWVPWYRSWRLRFPKRPTILSVR